jgi:hypothetical protein
MAVCPTCFKTVLTWPLSALAIGETYTYPFPNGRIVWNQNMNTGVVPNASSMQLLVDGVADTISNVHWNSATELDFDFVGVPTTSIVWKLIAKDSNLHSSLGAIAKPIQTQTLYP